MLYEVFLNPEKVIQKTYPSPTLTRYSCIFASVFITSSKPKAPVTSTRKRFIITAARISHATSKRRISVLYISSSNISVWSSSTLVRAEKPISGSGPVDRNKLPRLKTSNLYPAVKGIRNPIFRTGGSYVLQVHTECRLQWLCCHSGSCQ